MLKAIEIWLWRRYHRLRFQWLDHRRHNHLVLERVGGSDILVLPEVFNPALFWTSELLAGFLDQVSITPDTRVLDLGTGSGIGAVCAAQRSHSVIAVDINPEAVRCARINALLNRVEGRIQVFAGDLFQPVEGMLFDLILFNPPYLHGLPETPLEGAFYGGGVAERFAQGLAQCLAPEGLGLIVLSSSGEMDRFIRALDAEGFEQLAGVEKHLPGEVLTVFRVWKGNQGRLEENEC